MSKKRNEPDVNFSRQSTLTEIISELEESGCTVQVAKHAKRSTHWELPDSANILILNAEDKNRESDSIKSWLHQIQTKPSVILFTITENENETLTYLPIYVNQSESQLNMDTDDRESTVTLEMLIKQNKQLEFLNQVGRELTATLDLGKVIDRLLSESCKIIEAEGASVWLIEDHDKGELCCKAVYNKNEITSLKEYKLDNWDGIAGWVAKNGHSIIVEEPRNDSRFNRKVDEVTGFATESILSVPMKFRENTIGVLELVNKQGESFSEHDLSLIETLGAFAGIAIQNAGLVNQLQEKADELATRNEELDAFSHTVAHDLKSPLATINSYADLLINENNELSEAEQQDLLSIMAQNGQKMSNIIDALLLLGNVRNEELNRENLYMGDIFQNSLESLKSEIFKRDAELEYPDEWPQVLGYGPWLDIVWTNYINNAIKYGGDPPKVSVTYDAIDDDKYKFWIKDNGEGIPESKQNQLFKPFRRLQDKNTSGHGLGLSIVKRIIEKQRGEVGVKSSEGEGSNFWFTIPAATKNVD